jgi:hypothetical protein
VQAGRPACSPPGAARELGDAPPELGADGDPIEAAGPSLLSPLLEADGPRLARWTRIARGVACEGSLLFAITVLAPVLPIAAAGVDGALRLARRKPWMTVRLLPVALGVP